MENSKIIEYKSLYEYLGKAAGPQLGKEVNEAAKNKSLPIRLKPVSNPKFHGLIHLYPTSFLDSYFKNTPPLSEYKFEADAVLNFDQTDDLPF